MHVEVLNIALRAGSVDFSPELSVIPGNVDDPSLPALPPSAFQPGAVGDELYSPLVRITNNQDHIYNAPMIAFNVDEEQLDFCDGDVDHNVVHDSVVAICPEEEEINARAILHDSVVAICPGELASEPGTVTLEPATGFSFGRPVLYMTMDATAAIAASLEGANYAPALGNIPVGRDDSLFSADERLFGFTNGPTNDFDEVNPQRQGFNSALVDGGGPLNVLGGIPTIATDYSTLWDVNLGE